MNGGAPAIDRAEKIKWWDALDVICGVREGGVEAGLQMARSCQHPDAQWLVALFPAGRAAVTPQHLREVMLEQGEDPRAMFLNWCVARNIDGDEYVPDDGVLFRAAEMGYAPAQALRSTFPGMSSCWAQRSADQCDRSGLYQLAQCLIYGRDCERDRRKAIELFRAAAELNCAEAQADYGYVAFGGFDWQRFLWWGRAALQRCEVRCFVEGVLELMPLFAEGDHGRISFTVAPVIRKGLDVAKSECFGEHFLSDDMSRLVRLLKRDDELRDRARRAITCWSAVGVRHGIVKDIRVMIAKMAWEEVWRWGKLKR
jgi:hypothetical protein